MQSSRPKVPYSKLSLDEEEGDFPEVSLENIVDKRHRRRFGIIALSFLCGFLIFVAAFYRSKTSGICSTTYLVPKENTTTIATPRCVSTSSCSANHVPANCTTRLAGQSFNQDLPPLPTGLDCGLVLIAAGSPRCGSTTQEAWIAEALKLLGVPPSFKGYWNFHFHVNQSARQYEKTVAKVRKAAKGPQTVFLVKSHEFDPSMLHICQHAAVFTTHRSPLKMMHSAAEAWYSRTTPGAKIVESMANWIDWQRCWENSSKIGGMDQSYEYMKARPEKAFLEIVDELQRVLKVGGMRASDGGLYDHVSMEKMSTVIHGLSKEKNHGIPGSEKVGNVFEYWEDRGVDPQDLVCGAENWVDSYFDSTMCDGPL